MINKILIPAILSRYSPRADKSWSVTLNLNEPNAEQKVVIDRMHQQPVYVLIKDAEVNEDEKKLIESLDVTNVKTKSKSQILRQKMWKVWKNNFEDQMTEKEYYDQQMDILINHYDKK